VKRKHPIWSVGWLTLTVSLVLLCSCPGSVPSGEECIQAGPQAGYPLRPFDQVLFTGFTAKDPTLIDLFLYYRGADYIGVQPVNYPQFCFTSFPDRPNYHIVGWIDDNAYRDGGVPVQDSYCDTINTPNCHPQPGQPQGETTVTMYGNQNNIVIVPFQP